MINSLDDIMSESLSWLITSVPGLVAINIVLVDMFLVWHMILQGNMIKGSNNIMGRSSSK